MLPTRIKRRRKGYLEPSDSRWLATLYTHTKPYYAYDALGRPYSRDTAYPQKDAQHIAAFGYNPRSELTNAQLDDATYAYHYDNIGNRITAQEAAEEITYAANELNQYTQIDAFGTVFEPEYDASSNQTLVKTATGIWRVTYNAENRAVKFESADGNTIIGCAYDYMGRRFEKKVTTNGIVTLWHHYLYRGYLQIADIDLQRASQPPLWYITWDPTQPTATRPLAIKKDGTWYPYGWDAAKNITEIFTTAGQLSTDYVYSPFGSARPAGDVEQPIQWSSEFYDAETGLVYYNFRYYNSQDGRWARRDPLGENAGYNLYSFVGNSFDIDYLGLEYSCPQIPDLNKNEDDSIITKLLNQSQPTSITCDLRTDYNLIFKTPYLDFVEQFTVAFQGDNTLLDNTIKPGPGSDWGLGGGVRFEVNNLIPGGTLFIDISGGAIYTDNNLNFNGAINAGLRFFF